MTKDVSTLKAEQIGVERLGGRIRADLGLH